MFAVSMGEVLVDGDGISSLSYALCFHIVSWYDVLL